MFKVGDKFKAKVSFGVVEEGSILIAKEGFFTRDGMWYAGEGFVNLEEYLNKGYGNQYLEFIEEQFDLKKNPWFIRTGTKEKSEAAQKWLFEQGVHWRNGMEIKDHDEKYLTNADSSGVTSSYILQGRLGAHASAQEIILEFEIVVKSVTYPVVETEPLETAQDKKIKELKETIDKAQKQLEELMGK